MLIISGSERVEREREARFGPMSSRAWRKLEFKLLRSFICEEYLCIRTKIISKLSEVQTRGGENPILLESCQKKNTIVFLQDHTCAKLKLSNLAEFSAERNLFEQHLLTHNHYTKIGNFSTI